MATVYDKSSLFLAPSGVSNGTVFVQKPVPIYGSEQVTNGDFSQTGAEQVTICICEMSVWCWEAL